MNDLARTYFAVGVNRDLSANDLIPSIWHIDT
jgi:hypothetical protein